MNQEEKKKSAPLYSNHQTAASDLAITGLEKTKTKTTTKPKAHMAVITTDVKATKVTTQNSFAALPSLRVTKNNLNHKYCF